MNSALVTNEHNVWLMNTML